MVGATRLAGKSRVPKSLQSAEYVAAEEFAYKTLHTMERRTGESYAEHGKEVARTLAETTDDTVLLRVAVLHDILVHPDGPKLLRQSPLRPIERRLVEQMHKLRRLHINSKTKDLDTVIDAFLEEERLLPLRMAHRVNDVRHIQRFDRELKKAIADETLHMYSAIAGRLGMQTWRHEMEDICFKISYPKIATSIEKKREQMRSLDTVSLNHTHEYIQKILTKQSIHCDFEHRIKTLYSTYRKMVVKKRSFHELTDRLALRIIVPDVMDCYKVLALVHAHMHPIPGKLKDYIGSPKENGYQSIHTVVYPLPGVTEQPIEIQIRSEEMHTRCEFGAASHGEYKNFVYALQARPARVNLFQNLEHLREGVQNPKQFEQALRKYFSEDHIAVFDHLNNIYHFKKPVSVLDAVASMYPKKFIYTKEVLLNGRKRSLDTVLHDGDIIHASFGKRERICKEWLTQCVHAVTKDKIKEAMRST